MTTLVDLRAKFLRYNPTLGGIFLPLAESLADAHGVMFLCPKCFVENGGAAGTHSVICWFEDRVPDDARPSPGRWTPTGTGLQDLSFVHGKRSPSVQLLGSACQWHGFVNNGSAQ